MEIRWIFYFPLAVLLGACIPSQIPAAPEKSFEKLSPREKYVLAFNFIDGKASSPFPTIKKMGIPAGLDDVPKIYRLDSEDTTLDTEEFIFKISEKPSGGRLNWNSWPYSLNDLHGQKVDIIQSRECFDSPFNWPASGIDYISRPLTESESKIEEIAFRLLAKQFSDFIDADSALREKIYSKGINLFQTTVNVDLNFDLHNAWQSGKLQRPALMVPSGECSPDWVTYNVSIRFDNSVSRLYAIPEGDYILCNLEGVDPWDRDQCIGGPWEISSSSADHELFGYYYFRSVTSNGSSKLIGPIRVSKDTEFKF